VMEIPLRITNNRTKPNFQKLFFWDSSVRGRSTSEISKIKERYKKNWRLIKLSRERSMNSADSRSRERLSAVALCRDLIPLLTGHRVPLRPCQDYASSGWMALASRSS
jgi:hypothetical protein